MKKADLRKEFLERRKQLSSELAHQYSSMIAQRFLERFPDASTKTVHCYLPITSKNEVDTLILLERIFDMWPECTVIVPKSNLKTCEIENYIFKKDSQISTNDWGIPEPEACELCIPATIDYVITPLLAYDLKGNRVGYGKGFYDRFFSQCKNDVVKIGLCFFEPVPSIEDVYEHDVRLNYCVTPDKVYRFV